jgi:hypothetical protein
LFAFGVIIDHPLNHFTNSRNANGKEILKELTAIFDGSGYPKKLRNDSGGEFTFSGLAKFLKNKNIYQHFALNSIRKAPIKYISNCSNSCETTTLAVLNFLLTGFRRVKNLYFVTIV